MDHKTMMKTKQKKQEPKTESWMPTKIINMMCKGMMEATQFASLFFLLLVVLDSFGFHVFFAFVFTFFSINSEGQKGKHPLHF